MDNSTNQPTSRARCRLRIFGVGVAGISIVDRLIGTGLGDADTVAIATDAASLDGCQARTRRLLETKRLRGLGTGGDPLRGARAAEENLSELQALCEGVEMVFIVAGLGGGSGTGISPVIARLARQAGALVLGFAVLPFECEGEARALAASRGLEAFKAAADGVLCLPSEKVLKLIDEKASVTEAFNATSALMAEGVMALWRLMNLRGPKQLNFEDLSAVLKDRHAECLFAVAEAAGPDRVTVALERLRTHPLLEGGSDLERAEAVVVSVVSGPDLGMAELNRLTKSLHEACCRAKASIGIAVSPEYAERLVVTVIAACRAGGRRAVATPTATGSNPRSGGVADEESDELYPRLLPKDDKKPVGRPRYIPPPPEIAAERFPEAGSARAGRRSGSGRLRQEQLPLEVVSKGRFEKGEPTILHGEDLDVPTYVRRGVALN